MRLLAVLCALLPAACGHRPAPPSPHYVLGAPYQAGGVWRYPRERYDAVMSGLAVVYADAHAPLTADGEAFDQTALAVAHPTLQLPAIARLTDLDSGRQVTVRVNDRGPATPHRLIAVTRRTAVLLGFPDSGVARVRLQVLPAESHAAADALPGAPGVAIAAAPRGAVTAQKLAPPSGFGQAGAAPSVGPAQLGSSALLPAAPPMRLAESVIAGTPEPGELWVLVGSFVGYRYAAMQSAGLIGLEPEIVGIERDGEQEYRVRLGPFETISQADAALDQAIGAGVGDARIVVGDDGE